MRAREGEGEWEKHWCVRETSVCCLSHSPNWRPGLQPRHVPWLRIEPMNFHFAGRHSIYWTTPARVLFPFLKMFFILLLFYYSCPNFPSYFLPPHPPLLSQFPSCCPCPWVIYTCSLTRHFHFFPPFTSSPLHYGHYQSLPCFPASGSIWLICSFCSLGST